MPLTPDDRDNSFSQLNKCAPDERDIRVGGTRATEIHQAKVEIPNALLQACSLHHLNPTSLIGIP